MIKMKCLLQWVSIEDSREIEISSMEQLRNLSRKVKAPLIFSPSGFNPHTGNFDTPTITVYDDYIE